GLAEGAQPYLTRFSRRFREDEPSPNVALRQALADPLAVVLLRLSDHLEAMDFALTKPMVEVLKLMAIGADEAKLCTRVRELSCKLFSDCRRGADEKDALHRGTLPRRRPAAKRRERPAWGRLFRGRS